MAATKRLVSLRIDNDVFAWFRAHGDGYQVLMNQALRAFATTREFESVVVTLLKEAPSISFIAILQHGNVTWDHAVKYLEELVKQGCIEASGRGGWDKKMIIKGPRFSDLASIKWRCIHHEVSSRTEGK